MSIVSFDKVPEILGTIADDFGQRLEPAGQVLVIRDLWGRIRFVVKQRPAPNDPLTAVLVRLADSASEVLGIRAYPPSEAILYADEALTDADRLASEAGLSIGAGRPVFRLIDRQVSGQSWATVLDTSSTREIRRVALYSLKGGVGRSTATALAAWHLAGQGLSVLVLDLDLESPGLTTSLLPTDSQPEFGIVDWFVEDAVGQGDAVVASMSARAPMARDLPGDIWVVPSHGANPGDFMAKLGRCYLDLPGADGPELWDHRLGRLLTTLEAGMKPDLVLLDARSGFHDLASAAITELADIVLLFAVGSEQTWSGYRILFEHWRRFGVAEKIRERLQIVAALIPETDRDTYLPGFREAAWGLFRDYLYDELGAGDLDGFSFDLNDDPAPHTPLPVYWNRAFAALSSLAAIDRQLLDAAAGTFLQGLDELLSGAKADTP
jgi:hypothetical protein